MLTKLENCYDSHLHWQATGMFAHNLKLHELTSPEDLKKIKIEKSHMRGEWLTGWGWDQHKFADEKFPDRLSLDAIYPGVPVALTRVDGHAFWLSTEALKRAGLFYPNPEQPEGGHIYLDESGYPTGVLIDLAFTPVEKIIPKITPTQVRADLLKGIEILNRAGFTHIRDMSCDEVQWNEACRLADQNLLTMAIEQNFSADDPNNFAKTLNLARHAKKNHPRLLRPSAIKIYYDGALGSEGAYLSQPYQSGSGRGVVFLERIQLKEMIQATWDCNFDLAIHTIGDEAAHQVVVVANELWELGETGRLHLEHAEMLRPETVALLKNKNAICHMQPCHWLSDRKWLREKLGPLFQYVFPWAALEEAGVPFDFGSDSPIELPILLATREGLEDSAKNGVPPLKQNWLKYHSHADKKWTPNTFTEFDLSADLTAPPKRVVFEGKDLLT
jgi:predicted amidohydrolase YtcJ